MFRFLIGVGYCVIIELGCYENKYLTNNIVAEQFISEILDLYVGNDGKVIGAFRLMWKCLGEECDILIF